MVHQGICQLDQPDMFSAPTSCRQRCFQGFTVQLLLFADSRPLAMFTSGRQSIHSQEPTSSSNCRGNLDTGLIPHHGMPLGSFTCHQPSFNQARSAAIAAETTRSSTAYSFAIGSQFHNISSSALQHSPVVLSTLLLCSSLFAYPASFILLHSSSPRFKTTCLCGHGFSAVDAALAQRAVFAAKPLSIVLPTTQPAL